MNFLMKFLIFLTLTGTDLSTNLLQWNLHVLVIFKILAVVWGACEGQTWLRQRQRHSRVGLDFIILTWTDRPSGLAVIITAPSLHWFFCFFYIPAGRTSFLLHWNYNTELHSSSCCRDAESTAVLYYCSKLTHVSYSEASFRGLGGGHATWRPEDGVCIQAHLRLCPLIDRYTEKPFEYKRAHAHRCARTPWLLPLNILIVVSPACCSLSFSIYYFLLLTLIQAAAVLFSFYLFLLFFQQVIQLMFTVFPFPIPRSCMFPL